MVKPLFLLVAWSALALSCRKTQAPAPPAATSAPAPAAKADSAAPLAADYDPAALADKGQDPLQIYLAEPRSPTWAGVVEEAIGGQLRRDLEQMVPEARGLSMGCRTLSCLILIDVPKEKLQEASQVLALVTLGPVTVDLGLSPEGRGQVLFLTERRMADPATFTSWYRRVRKGTLDDIRSGKRPNTLPVASDKIPNE